MQTKHSGGETFLFAILLFVCVVLYLVYIGAYGIYSNSAATQPTGIPVSKQSPTPAANVTQQPTRTPTDTPTPTITPTDTPTPTPTPVYYNLIMRHSKQCLGVDGGLAATIGCGQSTQIWNIMTATTNADFLQLKEKNSGNCLAASSTLETDPFVLKNCSEDGSVLWQKKSSGGYFQLVNNWQLAKGPSKMCVDARQFDPYTIIQWFCKPHGTDDQLDNQLLCQTTTATDNCVPPLGVYVTNIQENSVRDANNSNLLHVSFNVTFSNTTGNSQPYRWFVQVYGQPAGQTTEQVLPIPPGTSTITVGPWNIGHTCTNFTAKAIWRRAIEIDGLLFSFKDPTGREYSFQFRVCF